MREMIYKKIGKKSDIENEMRYFNINQVEKERYYEERYIRRRKDTIRKVTTKEEYVQERRKTCTNEKRYT